MPATTKWATQEEREAWFRTVLTHDCPNCGANPCYFLCYNSPEYYSPEREREDALFNDSLPYDTWFAQAVREYERAHGAGSYCS